MPLSSDASKTLESFQKEYGAEKGKDNFYAYLNKHGMSDKGSMQPKKEEECPNCGKVMKEDEVIGHYEEEVKRMEEEVSPRSAGSVMNLALKKSEEDEEEVKKLEEEIGKMEAEEEERRKRHTAGEKHLKNRMPMGAPESEISGKNEEEILKEASIFITTLKATVDDIDTLMAKDEGWASNSGVSDKVAPSEPTYTQKVSGENVAVAVEQSPGFSVKVNWFNTAMAELKLIVDDADKFMQDAGWNSKEVVKEYKEHKSKWGKDYSAGT